MPAPILPSSGAHWIEPAGSGASPIAVPAYLVDGVGANERLFVSYPPAKYELVDTTRTGVYLLVAAGSFPGLPRLTAMMVGVNVIVY
jgi:hypothetical protein